SCCATSLRATPRPAISSSCAVPPSATSASCAGRRLRPPRASIGVIRRTMFAPSSAPGSWRAGTEKPPAAGDGPRPDAAQGEDRGMDWNRLDHIAVTLEDIATTLDEIKESGQAASPETLERIRQSVERAVAAIDRIENREADAGMP